MIQIRYNPERPQYPTLVFGPDLILEVYGAISVLCPTHVRALRRRCAELAYMRQDLELLPLVALLRIARDLPCQVQGCRDRGNVLWMHWCLFRSRYYVDALLVALQDRQEPPWPQDLIRAVLEDLHVSTSHLEAHGQRWCHLEEYFLDHPELLLRPPHPHGAA